MATLRQEHVVLLSVQTLTATPLKWGAVSVWTGQQDNVLLSERGHRFSNAVGLCITPLYPLAERGHRFSNAVGLCITPLYPCGEWPSVLKRRRSVYYTVGVAVATTKT